MVGADVTAIVLAAGTGSRLKDVLPTNLPKCLLPVGNQPLLNYVLTWLEAGGIKTALVAVRPTDLNGIKDAIASGTSKLTTSLLPKFFPVQINPPRVQKHSETKSSTTQSVHSSEESDDNESNYSVASDDGEDIDNDDDEEEQELEPLDCLTQMIPLVKTSNVLIVPCDFLASFSLADLLSAHLFGLEHAAITALFHPYPDGLTEALCPGQSRKMAADFPLVTVSADASLMLHYVPPGDVSAGDDLTVPNRVLSTAITVSSSATPLRLLSRVCDCHVYVCRTRILEKILRAGDRRMHASIRDDLLPFIIDQQTLPERRRVVSMADFGLDEITSKAISWVRQGDEPRTTVNPLEKSKSEKFGSNDPIRCYGYIASNSSFAIRVHTVANFVLANLNLPRFWSSFPISRATSAGIGCKETANASISSKARVGNDVLIGSGCIVGEKAVVNRCVLGRHCRIAEDAKVTDSVLFDNADIGPGCVVQNSVICGHCVLGEKSEVRESIVVEKYNVPKGSKHRCEIVGSEFELDVEDDDYPSKTASLS